MPRRRGIFKRKSDEESSAANGGATAPEADPQASEDPTPEPVESAEESAQTGAPDVAVDLPTTNGESIAERIRIAAQSAAEQAEERAQDEILALEQDLARAKGTRPGSWSRSRAGWAKPSAAPARPSAGPTKPSCTPSRPRRPSASLRRRARRGLRPTPRRPTHSLWSSALAEAEDQVRSATAEWLREQLNAARDEADRRQANAVGAGIAETEERLRAEFQAKAESGPDPELERLRGEVGRGARANRTTRGRSGEGAAAADP